MKITIESTPHITYVNGEKVRVWNGVTERGVKCIVFVQQLAVAITDDASEFERELEEQLPPGAVIPLRHIL